MTEATRPYPSPRELLRFHGLSPKKAWGQNFLADGGVLDQIVAAAGLTAGAPVVELGGGLGHLSHRLALTGAALTVVERDRELVPVLEQALPETVRVLAADAKKIDLAALRGEGAPLAVVGNLPYHLTSPILFHLLAQREHLVRVVAMMQREVAERLLAAPGGRDYGVLSARFQPFFEISHVVEVGPEAFVPPPKVTSAVLRLERRATPSVDVGDEACYEAVVRAAFSQRRKKLRNTLKSGKLVAAERLDEVIEAAGLSGDQRPEQIAPGGFAALSRAVSAVRAEA